MRNFNHSIGVLVKAYFNGTLQNMNCYACAVGNLVADACGYKMILTPSEKHTIGFVQWEGMAYPTELGWYGVVMHRHMSDIGNQQIKATGYSVDELRRIEKIFEETCDFDENEESLFKGLMAVVDVLADMHGVDLSVKESAKLLFVKA